MDLGVELARLKKEEFVGYLVKVLDEFIQVPVDTRCLVIFNDDGSLEIKSQDGYCLFHSTFYIAQYVLFVNGSQGIREQEWFKPGNVVAWGRNFATQTRRGEGWWLTTGPGRCLEDLPVFNIKSITSPESCVVRARWRNYEYELIWDYTITDTSGFSSVWFEVIDRWEVSDGVA